MTTPLRQVHPQPALSASQLLLGQVQQIDATEHVTVQVAQQTVSAMVATHIPGVIVGQQVLLAQTDAAHALIVAAWPMPGAPITPAWQLDKATQSLSLDGVNVSLSANTLLLRSAQAQVQLSSDGHVTTRGHNITSAAVETYRIEGGVIELN